MATMGRGLPLSKVRLTDNFHVLKHNEEICSAAEAPPGAALITRTTWSLKGCSYEYSKPSSTGVARSVKGKV